MRRLLLVAAAAATLVANATAADTYPSRPITIVVPFSAGGPTDTLCRIMAERMRVALGQTVIVENTTGASGSIAVARVVRSAPDGYTVSIGHWGTHVLNGAIFKLPYDLLADLEPVALIANNPQLLVGKEKLPPSTLQELIAWLKANPDKAAVGTSGSGSPSHVAGAYFQNVTKTSFQLIPYRGAAPVMQDLLAGQIDLTFDQASNSIPQVRGGKIKAYAVTAKTRLDSAKDIPTVDEAGLPGFYISVWHGLWVPKGTPKDVIAKLDAAVVEALADEHVRQRLAELGQEIPTPAQQTPEGLRTYHRAEIEKWWPIIKAANIKVQ